MTTTNDLEILNSSGWVQVSTGSSSVTVQLRSDGPLRLMVGSAAPAADAEVGFFLSGDGETSFAGNALAGTDNVYVRATRAGDAERVTVMAT